MVKYEIVHRPFSAVLRVELEEGESVYARRGAFLAGEGSWRADVRAAGSGAAWLFRKGSYLLNYFEAGPGGATLLFAPSAFGDIEAIELYGVCRVHGGAYLAHHGDVRFGVSVRGLRWWLAGGEFLWLTAAGSGTLWVSACGGVQQVELDAGQAVTVDNDYVVAACGYAKWSIAPFGRRAKTFLLSGEGLVLEARGPATLYLQTRAFRYCGKRVR